MNRAQILPWVIVLCMPPVLAENTAMPSTALEPGEDVTITEPPAIPPEILKEALKNKMPLGPNEIVIYRQQREDIDRAKQMEIKPVRPQMKTTMLEPESMAKPPILKLRIGYTTTVVFRDAMGKPYKVTPSNPGDNDAYKVVAVNDNTFTIFATAAYRPSNMSVQLDGIDIPVMLHLVNGEEEVDYLRVFSVQRLAPATREKLAMNKEQLDPVPLVNDADLTRFLDQLEPPNGAEVIPVLEPGYEAWWFRDRLIVRTRDDLLSPDGAPLYGANGWRIYEILNPVPVLVFSTGGSEKEVHLVLDEVKRFREIG